MGRYRTNLASPQTDLASPGANLAATRTTLAGPVASRPRRDLADLGELAIRPSVERAVEAVRDFLGMDVAYTTEFVGGEQQFRVLRGDGASFGIHEGLAVPLEQTYCQRVLDGRLPNLMPDVRGDERSASLPATEAADVGAYATVPITLSDGRLYGTLCAGSHDAQPSLDYRDLQFLRVFARIVADQIEHAQQAERTHALELRAGATSTLLAAVGARDGYTAEHSQAVLDLAVRVARRLGLDEPALDRVRQAALLHDIGKIAIPDAVLNKPGPLTVEEWEVMRTHPVISEEIAISAGGLEELAPVLRAEHERWDGGGYPDGLAGEQIPLASRITFVCDAYHAMTSDRPYRSALSLDAAREQIAGGAGTQFCPSSARALLEVLADG
jgi:putative nucleotidyltransferase with HDIG domain